MFVCLSADKYECIEYATSTTEKNDLRGANERDGVGQQEELVRYTINIGTKPLK